MDFEKYIFDYIQKFRPYALEEMSEYRKQQTLSDAITVAAKCRRSDGLKHNHQRRIPNAVLEEAEHKLREVIADIEGAKDFEALHAIVSDVIEPIHGIGELTIYYVAQRIGAFRNIVPNLIYLHAGTRIGARALGLSGKTICKLQLPPAFAVLSESEIEDFLCIYKNYLLGVLDVPTDCSGSVGVKSCMTENIPLSRC